MKKTGRRINVEVITLHWKTSGCYCVTVKQPVSGDALGPIQLPKSQLVITTAPRVVLGVPEWLCRDRGIEVPAVGRQD